MFKVGNNLKLSTKIVILSFFSVLLVILVGGLVMVKRVADTMENEMGMRALAIARTMAQMPPIQDNIENPEGWKIIQPIAEKTRVATGTEYIVVVGMNGLRYSHPVADRIGKPFTGEDLAPALSDQEIISPARGVLGPSIRALVPVKIDDGTRQVGVVAVGILTPTPVSIYHSIRLEVFLVFLLCSMLGFLGSIFLARRIKKAMFRMEPEEIATLLEERIALFQALGEGIIAIDSQCRITVLNAAAIRILGLGDNSHTGRIITDVIADSSLPRVLESGEPEYNQERLINNVVIITNRVPVRVSGVVVGAVATFRDRTEIHRLAEELTGVKAFVEALRVQNHEHLNRLHTIAGLIQLKQHSDALEYVFDVTEEQQNITTFLTRRIKDNSIAGLILGKYSRAREIRANMTIDPDSLLSRLPGKLDSNALVVIMGNLLENAIHALKSSTGEEKNIYLYISDRNRLINIIVRDSGPGIPVPIRECIFKNGFSTKSEAGHGLGLYIVKEHVKAAGGSIFVECPPEGGTVFEINIPF
ncbi:MAG: histidine kinase [Peptococcaceae bacterium BICA1-7]|nr:MAG: histidine kinase [Peptococcaceae bacterium BICA1-7]HBV96966.1 sensor histidine kinase [Desulfotomaculum sp.]